eukprot:1185770-Prorocentrum_minimum.AAC.2
MVTIVWIYSSRSSPPAPSGPAPRAPSLAPSRSNITVTPSACAEESPPITAASRGSTRVIRSCFQTWNLSRLASAAPLGNLRQTAGSLRMSQKSTSRPSWSNPASSSSSISLRVVSPSQPMTSASDREGSSSRESSSRQATSSWSSARASCTSFCRARRKRSRMVSAVSWSTGSLSRPTIFTFRSASSRLNSSSASKVFAIAPDVRENL